MILILAVIASLIATPLMAKDSDNLAAAKAKYLNELPISGEAARLTYVRKLVEMHYDLMDIYYDRHFTDAEDARFNAINEEIKKLPAPKNEDSKALSKLRAGKWESPRHDYIFRSDGTWSMLPIEDQDTTHGSWSIKGNQDLEGVEGDAAGPGSYTITIILLDKDYFVSTDKQGVVFYELRLTK